MSTLYSFTWLPPETSHGTYKWVAVTDGKLPEGALRCGMDKDNTPLYAGRSIHAGDLLPAKISCSSSNTNFFFAYVPYNGEEFKKDQFEVIVSNDVAWKSCRDGDIPPQAIVAGKTANGENLYIGRSYYDGTVTPGKIQPPQKSLFMPYGGKEVVLREYEVLVLT